MEGQTVLTVKSNAEPEKISYSFRCCICLDLLYKPIVLCKLIVVSVKTSEILKFLFSLNFSFVSSLWWQLVVTFHVSGVSIDR